MTAALAAVIDFCKINVYNLSNVNWAFTGTQLRRSLMQKYLFLLLAVVFVCCGSAATRAHAQIAYAPSVAENCRDNTMAGETFTDCGNGRFFESIHIGDRPVVVQIESAIPDYRTCRSGTFAGIPVIECASGRYQWVREDGLRRISPLPILSGTGARLALTAEQYRTGGYRSLCYERFGGYTCLEPWNERNMREHCMNRYGISTRGPLYYRTECAAWRDRYEEARLLERIAG